MDLTVNESIWYIRIVVSILIESFLFRENRQRVIGGDPERRDGLMTGYIKVTVDSRDRSVIRECGVFVFVGVYLSLLEPRL